VKIAIGADHAGYRLKQAVAEHLRASGHEVADFGTNSEESVDYPEYAEATARAVANGEADRGVLVCGSGAGVCIAANKVDGIRGVNAHDVEEAVLTRQHNNANVLCLSGRRLSEDQAFEIVDAWLAAEFEGGRHERRVDKIHDVEVHNRSHAGQTV
jgi:ribose 5-phosphate isomerase B